MHSIKYYSCITFISWLLKHLHQYLQNTMIYFDTCLKRFYTASLNKLNPYIFITIKSLY